MEEERRQKQKREVSWTIPTSILRKAQDFISSERNEQCKNEPESIQDRLTKILNSFCLLFGPIFKNNVNTIKSDDYYNQVS